MAEFTRPASWEDVKRPARYLEEVGAQYALIGGYGLAANGFVRLTEDIDILVDPSADNSRRWIVALSRLPDGAAREFAADPDVFAQQKSYAIRINDEIMVDVLPAMPSSSPSLMPRWMLMYFRNSSPLEKRRLACQSYRPRRSTVVPGFTCASDGITMTHSS